MKKFLLSAALLLVPSFVYSAAGIYIPPMKVREADLSVSTYPLVLEFPNNSLTALGSTVVVSFAGFGGGGGSGVLVGTASFASIYWADGSSAVNTGTQNQYQIVTTTIGKLSNYYLAEPATSSATIRVTTTAVYQANIAVSFSGTANHTYDFALFINSVEDEACHLTRKLGAGGDVGSAGAGCLVALSSGDIVDVRLKSTSGAENSITVQDFSYMLHSIAGGYLVVNQGGGTGGSDNLGSHIATQSVNFNSYSLFNATSSNTQLHYLIKASSLTLGISTLTIAGTDIKIGTQIANGFLYLNNGFLQGVSQSGGGSGTGGSDNLGSHVSTQSINMSNFAVMFASSVVSSSGVFNSAFVNNLQIASGTMNNGVFTINNGTMTFILDTNSPNGAALFMTLVKNYTIAQATGGSNAQMIFEWLGGNNAWGTHIHQPATQVGGIGIALGVHGPSQRGMMIVVDDATGTAIPLHIVQNSASGGTHETLLLMDTKDAWQYLISTGGHTGAGSWNGDFVKYRVAGSTVGRVDSQGSVYAYDSTGGNYVKMQHNGTAGFFQTNSGQFGLAPANGQVWFYDGAISQASILLVNTGVGVGYNSSVNKYSFGDPLYTPDGVMDVVYSAGGVATYPLLVASTGTTHVYEANSSSFIVRPASVAINNVPYTWPYQQSSTSGMVLTNNGAGILSWANPKLDLTFRPEIAKATDTSNTCTIENSTGFKFTSINFDNTQRNSCYFPFIANQYNGGKLEVELLYTDNGAGSGSNYVFDINIDTTTPGTPGGASNDLLTTRNFNAVNSVTCAAANSAYRINKVSVGLTNASLKKDDYCVLQIARDGPNASDTASSSAKIIGIRLYEH